MHVMQSKKFKDNLWVIRLKKGEKIIQSLSAFCQAKKINGGFFFGVGAVSQAELAHYDVFQKKYSSKKFNQPLEMINISGSIGQEKKLIVHAHAVFADPKMKTIGGHLVEATISGTAEICLIKLPSLKKKYDPQTGLKIFHLQPQED